MLFQQGVSAGHLEIVGDHFGAHFLRGDLGRPAKQLFRLGRIAEQRLDLGGPEVTRVDPHHHVADLERRGHVAVDAGDGGDLVHTLAGEVERYAQFGSGLGDELAHRILHASADHEILGHILLQHHPLHAHVVLCMAPVPQRIDIAHVETGFEPLRDIRKAPGDLAGDECLAAARALVIEQDAVAGIHVIGLAVVHRDPVGIHLGHRVRRARVERRGLGLRDFLHLAVKLGGRGLVEPGLFIQPEETDRLEQAQRAGGIHVGGIFRRLETDRHMGLRAKVIDLVRGYFGEDPGQVRGIGQIAVMQLELGVVRMRVLVDMVDPLGVEQRRPALDPVHLIALFEQEFGKVGSVLPGDAGDKRFLRHVRVRFILIYRLPFVGKCLEEQP